MSGFGKRDGGLPTSALDGQREHQSCGRSGRRKLTVSLLLIASLAFSTYHLLLDSDRLDGGQRNARATRFHSPASLASVRAQCASLQLAPESVPDATRTKSERYVQGTKPLLIKNATIWTGRLDGEEIIYGGDVLMKDGVIRAVGRVGKGVIADALEGTEAEVVEANGAWITPGIVDLHSHLAVESSPSLRGAQDGNSRHGITQPWLRSLDGLNTHDDAYALSIAGGVTTSLILPGSANAIGGQGFVIKLRPTSERSPTSMLLDPPNNLFINNSWAESSSGAPKWRQMKHACGENPSRVYGNTRMDNIWSFRTAYDTARQLKEKQDALCERVSSVDEISIEEDITFPENLQWEALVDVLRGRVKVHVHCYETVDLDDVVRLTNEFQFSIAAFHHAHETYLVPDLLKKAYGHAPASAIFATNARYKREAFRGSEFAARILNQNGLKVVMKVNPVLNSRYLLYEAQQAFYYGLPANVALAAVTTTPAEVLGVSHRVGSISEGLDADVVVWDSHPLALGATPKQVYIDGLPQIHAATRDGSFGTSGVARDDAPPYVVEKPASFQVEPRAPNWDKEVADAVKWEGLPPIAPSSSSSEETLQEAQMVVFTNVSSVSLRVAPEFGMMSAEFEGGEGVVVVKNGQVLCADDSEKCRNYASLDNDKVSYANLMGGSVSKGLTTYGSPLGMEEIEGELSTSDGIVWDTVLQASSLPKAIGNSVIRGADGLAFGTRHAYLAYRAGVTTAISAPKSRGFLAGLGVAFSVAAPHSLAKGAVVSDAAGLHISVGHYSSGTPSVGTQIGVLRRLLLEDHGADGGEVGAWFGKVAEGKATLVVEAQSADVIASLLHLKHEVESAYGSSIKLTIAGAAEAHLLAKEISEAGVGIVFVPSRPFPTVWEDRRMLPGPPLTQDSAISLLLSHNVTVAIGVEEPWSARNTRFDAAWAALEASGSISQSEALALASSNLEKLLGVEEAGGVHGAQQIGGDLVATSFGGILDFESKVVGVISPRRGLVDLF
ncbi:composite domain of metallo-dependent hydrolase [Schizopora paradoxa]|uniref:Composite domain of metallo-dependent hydrolase n=1 Tax=Schizopora paradoxa TaxID=27342 RepID=A0A0H2SG57_9AGAM|nr:composite domain of metallo-dependent hydrolase [Schizopora paradoxa]